MSVKKLQLMELFAELDAAKIAEQAEQDFQKKAVDNLRFSEKLTSAVPAMMVCVWFGAYVISAPHTATLFKIISPVVEMLIPFTEAKLDFTGLAPALSPLVMEGFTTILAALQENERNRIEQSGLVEVDKDGKKKKIKTRYDNYLFWLMTLLVFVNVLGGLVAIYEHFFKPAAALDAAFDPASAALVSSVSSFNNPFDTGWFLIAIIAGILVPFIALLTGRVLAEAANGTTTLEIKSSAGWYGLAKYNALKRALLNEALKVSSPGNAAKYAERMAWQLAKDELNRLDDGTLVNKQRSLSSDDESSFSNARSPLSYATGGVDIFGSATVASISRDSDSREIGFIKNAHLRAAATGQARNLYNDGRDSSDSDSLTRQDATAASYKIIDAQEARRYIETHPSLFADCKTASDYLSILQQNGMSAALRTIQRALKAMRNEG